jgi:hypothetical protein
MSTAASLRTLFRTANGQTPVVLNNAGELGFYTGDGLNYPKFRIRAQKYGITVKS